MARSVENDDFCKYMSNNPQIGTETCTHFNEDNDECSLPKCAFSPKWLRWFEEQEAID